MGPAIASVCMYIYIHLYIQTGFGIFRIYFGIISTVQIPSSTAQAVSSRSESSNLSLVVLINNKANRSPRLSFGWGLGLSLAIGKEELYELRIL